jgi:hypothetical protein
MADYERNVYYNPHTWQLEPVAQIDYSNGSYCFDYRIVWKHVDTGLLYTARDSGCSCPSPFEGYKKLADLDRFALSEIEEEAKAEARNEWYSGDPITPFLEEIRKLNNEPRAKAFPGQGD